MRIITFFVGLGLSAAAHSAAVESDFVPGASPAHESSVLVDKMGDWIGYTEDLRDKRLAERPSQQRNQKEAVMRRTFVAPLLRQVFRVEKPVESATAYICGLGLYELYLNGERVGDRVLDPAQTTYDKRAFYVKYDIADDLSQGVNAVGVMLGNGFYGQNFAFGGGLAYGPPRARVLIDIQYTDGTTRQVRSSTKWAAAQSPVVFDNIYAGETYDARLEQPGWSTSRLRGAGDWASAEKMEAPTGNLIEQQMEPMRKNRSVRPVDVLPGENGEWILDMGQNMTGWLHIRVEEPRGTAVTMRFAEHLMPDGKSIDTASTGVGVTSADQTDVYICRGGGPEEWEPRFTYHGFRYVQIAGLSRKPDPDDYTGWLVRTDVERIGSFECSDPILNTYYEVSMWTIEDNLQGILTDCPHRERCAWMGDMHAVAEAASYNFDLRKFWSKSSADMRTVLGANAPVRSSQLPSDARAPGNIAVGKRLCGQARPDWGAATVLVPWFNWLYFGDLETVKAAWPMMTGWMDFLAEHAVRDGIIEEGYGDWCPPGSNSEIDTPVALTSTALYYRSLDVMRRMAAALGEDALAERYATQAAAVKEAFNARFLDRKKNHYGSQTGTAVALQHGLVPDGGEQAVADGLARLIMEESAGRYTTGIFGHRPLYTLLNDYGHADVTRHLWHVEGWPGLRWMTETHGLTTWPEVPYNWPAGQRYRRNSFNHPMHSGFAAAFHESLGGIRPDPDQPGFRHFIFKPCFLPGLEWAKVSHRSPHGMIASHWQREGDSIAWNVTVPDGSSARVEVPPHMEIRIDGRVVGDDSFELEPGSTKIELSERKVKP